MNQKSSPADLPRFVLPIMAAVVAIGPFAIDAYLPAFPYIAADLGVSPLAVGYSLSAYLFGMAFGQLLGGPISDQIGRRNIAAAGLSVFVLASIAIMFVDRLDYLIAARAVQAIGAGFASAVVMPTIRDLSPPEKLASRLAMVFFIMLVAPLIAPIIGVGLMQLGWRWIFGFLALYCLFLLVIYLIFLPETKVSTQKKFSFKSIYSQYRFVFQYRLEGVRVPILYGLSAALSSSIMLIYVFNASFIFQTYFGVSDVMFPLFFGVNVLALGIVQGLSARYLRSRNLIEVAAFFRFGQRLQLIAISLLCAAVIFTDTTLWIFVPLMVISLACLGIVSPSGSGLFLASFDDHSGSASSILTTGAFAFGGLLGVLSGLLNKADLLSIVGMMLIATLLANLLLMTLSRTHEKSVLEKVQSGEIAAV